MKIGIVGVPSQSAISTALSGSTHTLIWSAGGASEALRKLEASQPEVLLVSASLSEMSPAAFTRAVLSRGQCAVLLVVDSDAKRVSEVYEAMGVGALDVVTAPVLDSQGRVSGAEALLLKLRTAARLCGQVSQLLPSVGAPVAPAERVSLVAIGASTGGPQALFTILAELPAGFPAAIVIIQHVDKEFSEGLASWLRGGSAIGVDIAREGAAPSAGRALIAATSDHMVMTAGGTLRYRAEPVEMPYRPSVDVFFSSLAEHWSTPAVAVLLTGMGRDGARGMKQLRQLGWHTIAQDEASSVVYGMPKAAALLGAACKILPPLAIAAEVMAHVGKRRAAH